MTIRPTDMNTREYLTSLNMDGRGIRAIAEDDGAVLYIVGAHHLVLVECIEHTHRGWKPLKDGLPTGYGEFAAFEYPGEYRAHHFGPPWSVLERHLASLPQPPAQRRG